MVRTTAGSVEPSVIAVRGLGIFFATIMLLGIIWASAASGISDGLRYLMADRWAVVTLLDVYAGAVIVGIWIWSCERKLRTSIPWFVGVLCLGHLVSLVYLIVRTVGSRNLGEIIAPSNTQGTGT